jgi:RNA polymerase sigma-70 factor, ECF subfamily
VPAATHGSLKVTRMTADEELMRRVQAGDTAAFGELYDRHAARAWNLARSICHDAGRGEDVVQEAFLSAWRSRAVYDSATGSVSSWLMALVRNRSIDSLRRERAVQRPPLADGDYTGPDPAGGSVQDDVIARTEAATLRVSLRRLPGDQAEVIALAYYGELSHSEIAARLRLPQGTVKGRMRLGLQKLREQVEPAGGAASDRVSSRIRRRAPGWTGP